MHRLRADELPPPVSTEYETTYDGGAIAAGADHQHPALLDPEPYDPGYCCDYDDDCCAAPQAEPYYLRFRGGMSYLDQSQTDLGGAYGLDLIVPVSNSVGGYANVAANHVSGSTHLAWTAGVIKGLDPVPGLFVTVPPPDTPAGEFASRFSYSVLFDNLILSDMPSATGDTDLYLGQIRSTLGFRLSPDAAVGLVYTKPLRGDAIDVATAFGAVSSPIEFSEGIGPYYSTWVGDTMFTASATYRDGLNAMLYSINVRSPLCERITAFVNGNYQDEETWASYVGIEIALGPRSSCCGHTSSGGCCASVETSAQCGGDDVVRGQPLTEEQRRQFAYERQAYIEGICGVPAMRYRNRRGDPANDPAHSETVNNNNDPATLLNSVFGMGSFRQVMQADGFTPPPGYTPPG